MGRAYKCYAVSYTLHCGRSNFLEAQDHREAEVVALLHQRLIHGVHWKGFSGLFQVDS